MKRIIGYDSDGRVIQELEALLALPGTAYLSNGFQNPAPDQLDKLAALTGRMPPYDLRAAQKHLSRWIPGAGTQGLPEAVWQAIDQIKQTSPGTAYTAYAKLLCWLSGPLAPVMSRDAESRHVIISGPLSKHGLVVLEVLEKTGVEVIYFDPVSDMNYKKADPDGSESVLIEHDIKKPLDKPLTPAKPKPVRNIQWQENLAPWDAVLCTNRPKGAACVRAYIMGTGDRPAYRNILYNLKTGLEKSGRKFQIITQDLTAPVPAETDKFKIEFKDSYKGIDIIANLIAKQYNGNQKARDALEQALCHITKPNLRAAYNEAIRTACWFTRLANQNLSCVIRYGPIVQKEIKAYQALSDAGCDVIWFDPGAAGEPPACLLNAGWTIPSPMTAGEYEPYPTAPERARVETVAHAASRELDKILYSDTGLHRDHQFARSMSVTLRTTLDEIIQLWPEPPNVRPGFETDQDTVTVPCLFSKIAGVPNGDEKAYWSMIRGLITNQTYLVGPPPFIWPPQDGSCPVPPENPSPEEIDRLTRTPYLHLPDVTRHRIFSSAAVLCGQSSILKDLSDQTQADILTLVRDMPRPILDLIQTFDPAKNVPKLLIVSTDTNILTRYEAIMIALLDIIGFDIAIFEPTGYQDIERYIKHEAFDLIQAGPYITDMKLPRNLHKKLTLNGLFTDLLG